MLITSTVNIIKNPFEIVASHMELALKAPNLLKLERQRLGNIIQY